LGSGQEHEGHQVPWREGVTVNGTILVAVNDSPAAFAAVNVAIAYAKRLGARLRAVMVIDDGELDTRLEGAETVARRRESAAEAVLNHVAALGTAADVTVEVSRRTGRVAAAILEEARAVDALLIVMARVDKPGHAIPSIGSHTLRVMEFATVPVLVVPDSSPAMGFD
jgi:nucleotide-binding universal stress UspA family protein